MIGIGRNKQCVANNHKILFVSNKKIKITNEIITFPTSPIILFIQFWFYYWLFIPGLRKTVQSSYHCAVFVQFHPAFALMMVQLLKKQNIISPKCLHLFRMKSDEKSLLTQYVQFNFVYAFAFAWIRWIWISYAACVYRLIIHLHRLNK